MYSTLYVIYIIMYITLLYYIYYVTLYTLLHCIYMHVNCMQLLIYFKDETECVYLTNERRAEFSPVGDDS